MLDFHNLKGSRGGTTLMVLVFLIMFIIIATSLLQLISRQSRDATDREQRELTFYFAESAVRYMEWVLSATGPGKPAEELVVPGALVSPLPGGDQYTTGVATYNQFVRDMEGTQIGEYFVSTTAFAGNTLSLETVAYPNTQLERCRGHGADLHKLLDDTYAVIRFEERGQIECPVPINGCAALPLDVQGSDATVQITSELSTDDCVPTGITRPADHYSWRADAGDRVYIYVESDDFTPKVTLSYPNGTAFTQQNCPGYPGAVCFSGGGETPSWQEMPLAGTYTLTVGSQTSATGEYKLSFTDGTALPN